MNLSRRYKVFAYPVRDLTIGRYLAAREVDFIGIELDAEQSGKTQQLIGQFREWLEGPKLIGICKHPEDRTVFENLDGYCHAWESIFYEGSSTIDDTGNSESPNKDSVLYHINNVVALPLSDEQNVFLESDLHEHPPVHDAICGFVIHPGSESQTGIFDFELLDGWLDRLEELNEGEGLRLKA